jgi:hypothetical protein
MHMLLRKLSRLSVPLVVFALGSVSYPQSNNPAPAKQNNNAAGVVQKDGVPPTSSSSKSGPTAGDQNIPAGSLSGAPAPRKEVIIQDSSTPAAYSDSGLGASGSSSRTGVPNYIVYEFFFRNVSNLDRVAHQADLAGKQQEALGWRRHDQMAAGLTDTEGDILREVAFDCNKATQELERKVTTAIDTFRSQPGHDRSVPLPAEIGQMWDQRSVIINAHIDQLRVALGPNSFQKLDDYVQSSFTPHTIAPHKPSPSPAPAKVPGSQQ